MVIHICTKFQENILHSLKVVVGGANSWLNFQDRGLLLIWKMVGQGPTALAVGAGGVVWTFFSRLSFSSFSLSGRWPNID